MDEQLYKRLIETFSAELESLLLAITKSLQELGNNEPTDATQQLIEDISRSGRNIKISAFAVGADDVGSIAEYIEKLYLPDFQASPAMINLTRQAVEGMRVAMRDFIENKPLSLKVRELIYQLQHQQRPEISGQETNSGEETPLLEDHSPAPEEITNTIEGDFLKKIVETFKAELQECLIVITDGLLKLEKGDKSEKEAQQIFEEIFRVAHNIKGSARGVGALDLGDIAHHIETLFSAIQKNNIDISPEIINLCLQSIDYMCEAMQSYSEKKPLSFDLHKHLMQLQNFTELPQSSPSQLKPTQPDETEQSNNFATTPSKGSDYESIRVSLLSLDRVSAYIEEMQTNKIAIEDHYSNLNKLNLKMEIFTQSSRVYLSNLRSLIGRENDNLKNLYTKSTADFNEIASLLHSMQNEMRVRVNDLSALFIALQDEVRMLRLIPIASQLRQLHRIVRDIAYDLNKQVNLEVKDNDEKIDKIILDGLKDPIMHILRNSIDHGIENGETRIALGKPRQGKITIDVYQESSQIVFKISDDGIGINTDDVSQVALQKNMITQKELESMDKEEIMDLVFRPGFSTKKLITDISGRGIGLDVVRSNLANLKGKVSLFSEPGRGTDFFLHVPLTLSTERGLFVKADGQIFVLVTSSVECVLLLKNHDIIDVEGSPAVLVNEQPILLCSLTDVLHFDKEKQNKTELFSVVVIKKNWKSVALLVDEIIGEKEIVLKQLQEPLANIPCLIGATLTGSNQINFVLNSSEIIKRSLHFPKSTE